MTLTTTDEPITIELVDGKYKLFIHDTENQLMGTVSYFETKAEAVAWWNRNKPANINKPGGYDG